jgi:riboflavin kinase/FMN adenylyltransferase
MQIYTGKTPLISKQPRGIALGFFDGLHRGHVDLIRTLVHACSQLGIPAAALTFSEHPDRIIHREQPFPGLLMTPDERLATMESLGLDEVYLHPFDEAFAAMEPRAFLDTVLLEELQAQLIVVGPDYRFGFHGAGTVTHLETWAEENQVDVIVVPEVVMAGAKVSSSRIRSLIQEGAVREASSLMGHPFELTGTVISGRGLGRGLGFPTANIELQPDKVVPAFGVYVSRVRVGDQTWEAITNIGLRPTIDPDEKNPSVETYLFHTEQILYDKQITVILLEWIRPELVFKSMLQLGQKIQEDLIWAHDWHHRSEQCFERIRIKNIPVWFLYSSRFATASMHVVFRTPVEPRQLACHALLVNVLTATCRRYPGRTQLTRSLDYLYGASLDGSVQKQGDIHNLVFTVEALTSWQKEPSPFKAACDLLMDILLDPDTGESGTFREDIVETERQNLLLSIASRDNDPVQQAYDACLKAYCQGRVHGLPAIGTIEDLQDVSLIDLQDAYRRLLTEMEVTVYIGGSIDPTLFHDCTQKIRRFPEADRMKLIPGRHPTPCLSDSSGRQTLHKDVEQARIVLAFEGLSPYFCQQGAMQGTILNSLLGGDVHSLLFQSVREEKGLAYQIFSLQNRYLSALLILAGVAPSAVEQTITEIKHQINKIVTEPIDPILFQRSKQMTRSGIESLFDDLNGLLNAQINAQATGRIFGRDDSLTLLESISTDDIKELAASLTLKTELVMISGRENE